MTQQFTLALPSKGAIAEPTYNFFRDCGLKIHKPNPRQYTGAISAIPGMHVLFQRVKDVVYKVADGTAQLGVTGYDVVREHPDENIVVIHDALGYGHCELVIAVPEAWVDVENIADLAEVALDFRENKGRNLRVATTYTHSTRQFLHAHQIHHFTLARAEGAIEVAPTIGYADIIVDLTATGTTLRENHLKQIGGGTIIRAQACLIGNRDALQTQPDLLDATRVMLEYMDATMQGREYYQITVDVKGETSQSVADKVAMNPHTRGLLGPTVAPIYSLSDDSRQATNDTWHTVTLIISNKHLLPAIEHLRAIGGRHAMALPLKYVFMEQSKTYAKLLQTLELPNPD
jgi:ATP phosphoribosyltransferase